MHPTQPVMKRCQQPVHKAVATPLPVFTIGDSAPLVPSISYEATATLRVFAPHEPPAPRRPDAPS